MIRAIGVHDVFSAMIAEGAGLPMLFLGGFGVSASHLGLPDLNFLTAPEMADAVRRVAARVSVPVVADGDTGHGDLHNVANTVRLFESAGAAGMLLEDQFAPKRCGHFGNKRVIPADEMVRKIKAALRARVNPDFVLFARTDARAVEGLDEAIARMRLYCEAGADVAFVEAPLTELELARLPRELPKPAMANMLTGGLTPILPAGQLEQMGFRIGVAPVETLMVCAGALRQLCDTWMGQGRVDHLAGKACSLGEIKQLLRLCEWDSLAAE